jgi:hypothetical protein
LIKLLLSSLVSLTLCLSLAGSAAVTRKSEPKIVLWSWQHDDDLSFLNAREEVAVAFYAGTIMLGRDLAKLLKRENVLRLPAAVSRFPVYRMENPHFGEVVSKIAMASALEIIVRNQEETGWKQVQIDFDATTLDRRAYLEFLSALKHRLRPETQLSITALSSWCLSDRWLDCAPVEETVAMFFSMGRGKGEALHALQSMKPRTNDVSRQSIGVSIYEMETNRCLKKHKVLESAPRIFVFSATGWTRSRFEQIRKQLKNSMSEES